MNLINSNYAWLITINILKVLGYAFLNPNLHCQITFSNLTRKVLSATLNRF
jgi:hypothetical protein